MLSSAAHMVYIVLSPLASATFAIMNILTVFIFVKRIRLATLSLIVIVNICVCDIFVCLASNSFYVVNLVHPKYNWVTGSFGCKVFKFLTMLTNVAQIYLLCLLCADRLRRLVYYNHRQWIKENGRVFISIIWTAATVLTLPRLYFFDEVKSTSSIEGDHPSNGTKSVNFDCKPTDKGSPFYVGATILTFVLAYTLPACFILYTLMRSQLFMWKKRRTIHITCNKNALTKMNNQLSLTFSLTAALFMIVWTPFFVMSLLELTGSPPKTKSFRSTSFSLRCTLLILGSAKPIIYYICLDKFRKYISFKYNRSSNVMVESSVNNTRNTQNTKTNESKA